MTIYFITRHPSAIAWAAHKTSTLTGNSPIWRLTTSGRAIASSAACRSIWPPKCVGAAYIHMVLTVPEHWRGKELSVERMIACGARLESYQLKKMQL
jgi:hypothetical protein